MYFNRQHYPELAPIPKAARKPLIQKICDAPMRHNARHRFVLLVGCIVTMAAYFAFDTMTSLRVLGTWTSLYVIAFLVVCTGVAAFVTHRLESRRTFLTWLAANTDHGRPHHCISCGVLLAEPLSTDCHVCDGEIHHFAYNKPGRPVPRPKPSTPRAAPLPSTPLPSKHDRREISAFLLNRNDDTGIMSGCLGELLANLGMFAALIAWLGLWVWIGFWPATAIGAVVIATVLGLALWVVFQHPRWMKKKIKKYCPDGVVPWCVHCDYDLRGHIGRNCPECGEAVFEFDPKNRWRREKRQAPQGAPGG